MDKLRWKLGVRIGGGKRADIGEVEKVKKWEICGSDEGERCSGDGFGI